MARVLRRHLVPRRAVDTYADEGSVGGSRRPSVAGSSATQQPPVNPSQPQREDSESFPIPYDAPGGDITYFSFPIFFLLRMLTI